MHRKKILLVDDDEIIRAVLTRELNLENYQVESAADGKEAMEILAEQKIDLVVTDLVMPKADGLSLLKYVKDTTPETPVIILTGYAEMSSVIEALQLGADDYQTKPCDRDALLFRISRCLEKQSLLQQLSEQNLQLKDEISRRKKVEEDLYQSEKRMRTALDASSDGVWDRDLVKNEVYFGRNWHQSLGYTDEDLAQYALTWEDLVHPEDMPLVFRLLEQHIKGESSRYEAEYRLRNKCGEFQWILSRGKVVAWDEQGVPGRIIGTHTDITRLKKAETALIDARAELEHRVEERTLELAETNIALNVLLKKREQDKETLEHQVVANVTELIEPYLKKLKDSRLSKSQQVVADIIQSNLKELTSQFTNNLSVQFRKLTPTEIQVANLVKLGKRTKEIAEVMNLSPGTINIHRKNIRKKLGLTNQKVNLQSMLSSYA